MFRVLSLLVLLTISFLTFAWIKFSKNDRSANKAILKQNVFWYRPSLKYLQNAYFFKKFVFTSNLALFIGK